jgi:putative DNA primase/helicase
MRQIDNTPTDALRQFADAVYSDIGAVIHPKADGDLHRFDDPEGRRKNEACWYVLHLDGIPAGAYGNWRTGYQSNWRANTPKAMDHEDRVRIDTMVRIARKRREHEKLERQADAARRAGPLWSDAIPATDDHPYLASKHIPASGLRQTRDRLLVPLRDIDGNLRSLQTINPNGEKRFLRGGRITGCFALTGARAIPETGDLYIAEGWATAATIARTLKIPVVAAMNAGNLKPVAQAIRRRFPRLAIVVAADNDHNIPGNPGLVKAKEAAKSVQGLVDIPRVCMQFGCRCTDFNDTAYCKGWLDD